jgi:hypothetical protein
MTLPSFGLTEPAAVAHSLPNVVDANNQILAQTGMDLLTPLYNAVSANDAALGTIEQSARKKLNGVLKSNLKKLMPITEQLQAEVMSRVNTVNRGLAGLAALQGQKYSGMQPACPPGWEIGEDALCQPIPQPIIPTQRIPTPPPPPPPPCPFGSDRFSRAASTLYVYLIIRYPTTDMSKVCPRPPIQWWLDPAFKGCVPPDRLYEIGLCQQMGCDQFRELVGNLYYCWQKRSHDQYMLDIQMYPAIPPAEDAILTQLYGDHSQ